MIKKFKNEECFNHILKCEDHFMLADVFQAGFGSTPRKSSMCAYGTVLDYANFDKAWETIKDQYSLIVGRKCANIGHISIIYRLFLPFLFVRFIEN